MGAGCAGADSRNAKAGGRAPLPLEGRGRFIVVYTSRTHGVELMRPWIDEDIEP
jgi:hypothetical protein